MAKIDELLSKVLEADHKYILMLQSGSLRTHIASDERNETVIKLTAYVTELEKERDELKKQLADLTPHPDDAGYEADYDDHSRGW